MAYNLFLGILVSFMLVEQSYGHLKDLNEDDTKEDSTAALDEQALNAQNDPEKMMVHQQRFQCHCTDEDCAGGFCNALYCWKASTRLSNGMLQQSRGCFDKADHYVFHCRTADTNGHSKRHAGQVNITCCSEDLCNAGPFPELPPSPPSDMLLIWSGGWVLWVGVLASILFISSLGAFILYVLRRRARNHDGNSSKGSYLPTHLYTLHPYHQQASEGPEWSGSAPLKAVAAGDSTLREYLEGSVTSGSGSGLPLMVQRTLAKQIALLDCVGKGRYGEVWRGQWHADIVAVKIFFSRDEASWRRETEIYSTALLRHRHILGYIGSDMTSNNSCTQLWLITHYHPLGSLYDYLNRTSVNKQQLMTISLSIVSGLLHLHTEIYGTQGKPAIAHRDLKSKNILMKSNGECCIADLGLALARDNLLGRVDNSLTPQADLTRQGTRRYMAPELLDQSIQSEVWEAWRACDTYSLGLVLWETASCVGPEAQYRPPYAEHVPNDPSFTDMLDAVCIKGIRPERPQSTLHDPTLAGLWRIICELWCAKPEARLPTLRIKKSIEKLADSDPQVDLQDIF